MGFRRGFVSEYLDPLAVEADITAIVTAHPELCRLETLPHLSHGYFGSRVDARGMHPLNLLRFTAPGGDVP